jgi:hypothetical protein
MLIAILAAVMLTAAADRGVAGDAATTAQQIISGQIAAFLDDDMDRAYSYASPGIQQMFPTPEIFFQMVKKGYAPVYRPGNYAFGRSEVSADGSTIVQEVLIHAPDGQDWTAIYTLQRQPDGSYKISAVQMIKSAPPSA